MAMPVIGNCTTYITCQTNKLHSLTYNDSLDSTYIDGANIHIPLDLRERTLNDAVIICTLEAQMNATVEEQPLDNSSA